MSQQQRTCICMCVSIIQWNSHLRLLCEAVDLNTKLRKILKGGYLTLILPTLNAKRGKSLNSTTLNQNSSALNQHVIKQQSKYFLKSLNAIWLIKKILAFYITQRFISIIPRAHYIETKESSPILYIHFLKIYFNIILLSKPIQIVYSLQVFQQKL
jgi:hypothetical protein